MPDAPDARYSPAAERNRGPILQALLERLPAQGQALEIASGSGQHIAHFAAAMPGWQWLASEPDPTALASIPHWWPAGPPPLALDLLEHVPWPLPVGQGLLDLVYCANMLHASLPATAAALVRGAARHLCPGGQLVVYGPFIVRSEPTAPSNIAFDADLGARHPDWGLRVLDDLVTLAAAQGLTLRERLPMPAHNQLLFFTLRGDSR